LWWTLDASQRKRQQQLESRIQPEPRPTGKLETENSSQRLSAEQPHF
jgi:hypothetical protein